jgi:hypothetical protein
MWHAGDGMAWWMLFWILCELLLVIAALVLVAHFLKTPPTDESAANSDDPRMVGT